MNFTAITVPFIRDTSTTKTATVNYSNASGQTLTANQVLLEEGTPNNLGYLKISNKNDVTLNGTGVFTIEIEHYPTYNEVNKSKDVTIAGNPSKLTINFVYNSKPVTNDINLTTPNRTDKVIKSTDILPNVSDFDNDAITEIALYGNVSSFRYMGSPYTEGTFIPISSLSNDSLKSVANDQNDSYTVTVQYRVKDSNGNISN